MRKFWGFYDNGKYRVGCSGQSIYVYNQEDVELARFQDMEYAYCGAFVPGTNVFVAKSTYPKMAVYDLDRLELVKKFRSGRAAAQDEGFAFTPDGAAFYNIESFRKLQTRLVIYDSMDFSVKEVLFSDRPKLFLQHIEFDAATGDCYLLGYTRADSMVYDYGFIARLIDGDISDPKRMDKWRYDYVMGCKRCEKMGFTEKTMLWYIQSDAKPQLISLKDEYERL